MYVFGEEKNARTLIKNSFATKKKKCHPSSEPSANHSSNTKDHWSRILMTNITLMRKFEILRELPKCDTETRSEPMPLEKWCQQTPLMQGHPKLHKRVFVKNTVSVKHNELKCNEMRSACIHCFHRPKNNSSFPRHRSPKSRFRGSWGLL